MYLFLALYTVQNVAPTYLIVDGEPLGPGFLPYSCSRGNSFGSKKRLAFKPFKRIAIFDQKTDPIKEFFFFRIITHIKCFTCHYSNPGPGFPDRVGDNKIAIVFSSLTYKPVLLYNNTGYGHLTDIDNGFKGSIRGEGG